MNEELQGFNDRIKTLNHDLQAYLFKRIWGCRAGETVRDVRLETELLHNLMMALDKYVDKEIKDET